MKKGKYIKLPDGTKKEIFKDDDGNEYFISVSKPFRCNKDILDDINAGKGDSYVIKTTMSNPVSQIVYLYHYLDRTVGESIKHRSVWQFDNVIFKYYIVVTINHSDSYIVDDQLNISYDYTTAISFDNYEIAEEATGRLYNMINNFTLEYIEYMKLTRLNISYSKTSNLFMFLVKMCAKCHENNNTFSIKDLPFSIKVSEKILYSNEQDAIY